MSKKDLARNTNTPEEVLVSLSNNKDWYVRTCVARNPSTPEEVLTVLSKDDTWNVRCEVAENPNTLLSIKLGLTIQDDLQIYLPWKKIFIDSSNLLL